MRWAKPLLPHIEQLHSMASISVGAITSKRTWPQWQPPLCFTLCLSATDQLRCRFHLFGITAVPRGAVHLGAVIKNLLRSRNIGRLALPCFERRVLQCARIRESHFPRQRRELLHRI